jgi:hypothetical protein
MFDCWIYVNFHNIIFAQNVSSLSTKALIRVALQAICWIISETLNEEKIDNSVKRETC